MTDVRNNLPSASSLSRLIRCPGSAALIKELQPNKHSGTRDTQDASFGNEVHGLLSQGVSEMAASERAAYVAKKCDSIREKLRIEILGDTPLSTFVETRFWIRDRTGAKVFSAQVDWAGCADGKVLICDFKSLPGQHSNASENYQLLGQAVAVVDDDETRNASGTVAASDVYVAIIQPSITLHPEVCHYDFESIRRAKHLILQKIDESKAIGAPRIPGVHCMYCPASSSCPESAADLMALSVRHNLGVDTLTPEMVANMLPRLPAIKKIIKDLEGRAKSLADANLLPGYELKTVEGNRYIQSQESVQAVRDALADYLSKEDILPLLSLPFGELRQKFIDAYVAKERCDKVEAGKQFDKLMEPICEREQPKRLLTKIKQ